MIGILRKALARAGSLFGAAHERDLFGVAGSRRDGAPPVRELREDRYPACPDTPVRATLLTVPP